VHLYLVSLADSTGREIVEVCGTGRGAVTNPPLYDPVPRIAVAHDAANGIVQAFTYEGRLRPLWRRRYSHAAHMLLFSDTGELVLNDFHAAALTRTRIGRTFAHRLTPALQHRVARRIAARTGRDDVVVVDIATGQEKARAVVPSATQSLVLPAPGFNRDLYWCTLTTLARISVATPL
jgi:hypothetical protein